MAWLTKGLHVGVGYLHGVCTDPDTNGTVIDP